MKVDVTSILNQPGASMAFELSGAILPVDDDIKIEDPVKVRGVATSLGKDVYIQAHAKGAVELTCSRCLTAFVHPFHVDCETNFGEPGTASFSKEDVDFYPLDGSICHLDDMIGREIVLSLPMKPLCSEDCRGLCPECGANLNEGDCGCRARVEAISPFGKKLIDAMKERSEENGRS